MPPGEAPPAEKVRSLRDEGKSYMWIAERYGISVEMAYQLAHATEIDLRDPAPQDA